MELFLFFLFLAGIAVASFQDLKKREVDNWVNYFILISGFAFISFKSIFDSNLSFFLYGCFCLLICLAIGNLFYYGMVFAGGDAKLLIALFPLFIGAGIKSCLINFGIFILFLMISGSIWGLLYSFFFYFKDFNKINKQFKIEFKSKYLRLGVVIGVLFLVTSFFNFLFLYLAIFVFLVSILFAFAKSIEKISMICPKDARDLREGDWLAEDVRIKGKIIKYNWEGLDKKDIKRLQSYKKKVKIKDGIPFVPGFLIAFILYLFKDRIIEWFFSFI